MRDLRYSSPIPATIARALSMRGMELRFAEVDKLRCITNYAEAFDYILYYSGLYITILNPISGKYSAWVQRNGLRTDFPLFDTWYEAADAAIEYVITNV